MPAQTAKQILIVRLHEPTRRVEHQSNLVDRLLRQIDLVRDFEPRFDGEERMIMSAPAESSKIPRRLSKDQQAIRKSVKEDTYLPESEEYIPGHMLQRILLKLNIPMHSVGKPAGENNPLQLMMRLISDTDTTYDVSKSHKPCE
ncbi:Hypothetical predicted protein [Prunus dulcis]|uniref:Uncharacterized protein n=1 Tax=Prunus dulcis TaxID=3755 RepID=A0A5E4EZG8_PRUDU|nr:Hypothetical predicted protein [Prunus dulcis]